MKMFTALGLMIFLMISCATNSYIAIDFNRRPSDSTLDEDALKLPSYHLQFCGVTSRVKWQRNWFYLKMFGHQFEEWIQFAFIDELGETRRIEFKVIEKITNQRLARDDISKFTEQITLEMSQHFIWPARLHYDGHSLDQSRYVIFVYQNMEMDRPHLTKFEKEKNWRVVDPKGYIDVECDGSPRDTVVDQINFRI